MYSQKVIEHFRNPKNRGKIKDFDAVGKVGNLICGDVMWLYIKVAKNEKGLEVIENISFETFGCVAAIATSSMVTDLARGKTLIQAIKLDKQDIVNSLDSLPLVKIHCSVLAADALAEAIYHYWSKKGHVIPKELKKRHQRIDQEKKIIEKKYSGWLEKE